MGYLVIYKNPTPPPEWDWMTLDEWIWRRNHTKEGGNDADNKSAEKGTSREDRKKARLKSRDGNI